MVNFENLDFFRFFILLLKIASLKEQEKCLLSTMFFFICSEQDIKLFRRAKSVACLEYKPLQNATYCDLLSGSSLFGKSTYLSKEL